MSESQGLLRPQEGKNDRRTSRFNPRSVLLTAASLLIVFSLLGCYQIFGTSKPTKKNIIFFVTDGMGPASLSLTRSFRQYRDNLTIDDILELDKYLIGSSRTRSSSSLITDSAAGATAFSCAMKSYNSAIGVDPDSNPCGTVMEALKLEGYATGLVVTTRITDATPAAFSAHTSLRIYEDLIAQHQIGDYPLGRSVDLLIGGGRTHYYSPNDHKYGNKGSRQDDRNLIDEAKNQGWSYVGNRSEFDQLNLGSNVQLPLLALLDDYDIPFDLDRDDEVHPSLEEEALVALNALTEATKDSDKGFFLLVEGSRIDHAGHNNDPAAQVREVLAFDKAFKAVKDFADKSDVETILISTSDHETGGLATARQISPNYPDYIWYPEALLNAKHSGEYLNKKIANYDGKDLKNFIIEEILTKDLGIKDFTDEEVESLISHKANSHYIINNIISLRSQTGWSTHGHSAVDVNIYAYANKRSTMIKLYETLGGNHENIEIGQFIVDYFNLDLDQVTELVKDTQHEPKKSVKSDTQGLNIEEEANDHYHTGAQI
ncbi:Repressible alkaline phosphatase [Wickerhamomyces ciferrii]|uniref:Alkaline phosphatase n=1 Tax=Wickerhamomyces ciferrii (strain ATCC 14091 / BCRC 22168 / CBS 111 / JCM 3599 / NBRC 0793 / NRRL Y-1031 F-60-10) TaxID=1206466 RepID=K0KLN0_WICCF|nr:Repressible alkaline phosphatase [Wickerhamomyces ciferrii]CCH43122.1 Repressible alkaline phosphatase [Wickerhamomyces ciferrii]